MDHHSVKQKWHKVVSDTTPKSQPKKAHDSSGTTRRLSYCRLRCGKQRDCTKKLPSTCNGEADVILVVPLKEAVLQEASRSPRQNAVLVAKKRLHHFAWLAKGPDLDLNVIVDRSTTSSKLPRSRLRLNHNCRTAEVTICIISEDCSIALDSYRTVGLGMQSVQLIVIPDHGHEVHTDGARRKACPSSSEVHTDSARRKAYPSSSEELADIVRRRACPSSSQVLTGVVRRKGEVPILPPPKTLETR